MSILGLSSYFLWTQKGHTLLPLVRGSGFVCAFHNTNTFYHYHVLTAGHVSCPPHYKQIYRNSIVFKAVGERHVTTKLLNIEEHSGKVNCHIDLQFKQHYCPNLDVVSLRCIDESLLADAHISPFEFDTNPLSANEEVELCGVRVIEEKANPSDEDMCMKIIRLPAVCKAALITPDYGTVVLTSLMTKELPENISANEKISSSLHVSEEHNICNNNKNVNNNINCNSKHSNNDANREQYASYAMMPENKLAMSKLQIPLSMCGGPVLRACNGKCVGILVARIRNNLEEQSEPHQIEEHEHMHSSSHSTENVNTKDEYNSRDSRTKDDIDNNTSNSNNTNKKSYSSAQMQHKLCNEKLEPELDLSNNSELQSFGRLHAAFVPVSEFLEPLLQSEK